MMLWQLRPRTFGRGVMIARRRPMRCACSRPSPAERFAPQEMPGDTALSALPATKAYGVIKGAPAPRWPGNVTPGLSQYGQSSGP